MFGIMRVRYIRGSLYRKKLGREFVRHSPGNQAVVRYTGKFVISRVCYIGITLYART